MIDPLTVSGVIPAFIDFLVELIVFSSGIASASKDEQSTLQYLIKETDQIRIILKDLHDLHLQERQNSSSSQRFHSLAAYLDGSRQEMQSTISAQKRQRASRTRRMLSRFTWGIREKGIKSLLDKILQCKISILLALGTNHRSAFHRLLQNSLLNTISVSHTGITVGRQMQRRTCFFTDYVKGVFTFTIQNKCASTF